MEKIKVFTAFSGYDSQCMALDRLKEKYPFFDYELVGWSEIDKYAIQAHNAVYPQYADRNYGDISKIDWNEVPDFDLFTYSFPCQDISNAGMQRGLEEGSGTRSSLLWECCKAIEAKKPKYLLMENVKALTSKKFIPFLNKWESYLSKIWYSNFTKVLNAKSYGIPQNRERVFMVSILSDDFFVFPEPFELEKRLKDILEDEVDEKYYLSQTCINGFIKHNEHHISKGTGFLWKPKTPEDIACCIRANSSLAPTDNTIRVQELNASQDGIVVDAKGIAPYHTSCHGNTPKVLIPQATAKGYVEVELGGVFDGSYPKSKTRRGRVQEGGTISPTLTAGGEPPMRYEGIEYKGRIIHEGDGLYTGTSEKFVRGGLNGVSRTLKSEKHDAGVCDNYRIRKLTERECFRLMGVSEGNIDKIQGVGISKTQQYKMAGNSIVVDVLFHIFRKMFIEKENDSGQLTLF